MGPEGLAELEAVIATAIAASGGAISFERFMDLALYQPRLGYYTRPEARIGRGGDFVTSPALSPAFGTTLAGLLAPLRQLTTERRALRVVDAGAGEGRLLAPLIAAARGRWPAGVLEPVLVERGEETRRRAVAAVTAAAGHPPVALADTKGLAALEPQPGLVLANELLDALPVRRLRRSSGGVEECFVAADSGRLVETWHPCLDSFPALPAGRECAIAPGLPELVGELAAGIEQGVLLVIDYGYPARLLYDPEQAGNPVRGFQRGLLAGDLLAAPGTVDLTAHVDFSAVAAAGRDLGLDVLFFTEQTYLLLALGFLDQPRAAAAKRLIHPEDLGGAFKCLALGKAVDPGPFRALAVRDRQAYL